MVAQLSNKIYASTGQNTCDMTSSNGNIFRVTGHLCGEFTGPQRLVTGWVNIREAGNLRRYRAHYEVTVMTIVLLQ